MMNSTLNQYMEWMMDQVNSWIQAGKWSQVMNTNYIHVSIALIAIHDHHVNLHQPRMVLSLDILTSSAIIAQTT